MTLKERLKQKKLKLKEGFVAEETDNYGERYEQLKDELNEYLAENIDYNLLADKYNETERNNLIKNYIQNRLESNYPNMFISNIEKQKLILDIINDNNYFGPLSQLYEDSVVDAIFVNGFNEVLIEKGGKLFKTSVVFKDEKHLEQTINKIFFRSQSNTKKNVLSNKLPNGTTVNAILPPVAEAGGYLVIKKFNKKLCDFDELINRKFLTTEIANFLQFAFAKGVNIVITGKQETGKTTLLNALISSLSPSKRTVLVRKSYETGLIPANYIILNEIATVNEDLFNEINLLKAQQIVYPDIRKQNLANLLFNFGQGVLTTTEASSDKELIYAIIKNLSDETPYFDKNCVRSFLNDSLNLIVTTGRDAEGQLRVMSISQPAIDFDIEITQSLIKYIPLKTDDGKTFGKYQSFGIYPEFATADELEDFEINATFFEADYEHEYRAEEINIENCTVAEPVELETTFRHAKKSSIRSRFEK